MLGGCGSTVILDTVCSHLGGLKPGETTKDGKFTVIEVECQGACSNAPMLVVGDDFYEDLTPETTRKVLDAFARGEKPKPGPQSGRKTSENAAGLTALTEKASISVLGLWMCTNFHSIAVRTRRVLYTRVCMIVKRLYIRRLSTRRSALSSRALDPRALPSSTVCRCHELIRCHTVR